MATDRIRFKILYMGGTVGLKNDMVKTDIPDEPIFSPHYAILIKHPVLGNVLVDTGDDDDWEKSYSERIKTTFHMQDIKPLGDALKENGLGYDDIDVLVLTHLHFDHAGGLKHFAGTRAGRKVYMSEAEMREVFDDATANRSNLKYVYLPGQFTNLDIQAQPVVGSLDLADDLKLFVQDCHTAGVLGLTLTLKDGTNVLFTGDTVYTREGYYDEIPPGSAINDTDSEFFDNLHRLKGMQRETNAVVFLGHDEEQTKGWAEKGWITSGAQISE